MTNPTNSEDVKAAVSEAERLAKVYEARSHRPLTPDWSAETKRQDAVNAKAIRTVIAALAAAEQARDEAREALNTPEVEDFAKGVISEAQHQRHRHGSDHDAGKTPFDWFWLIGYLAQKAAAAQVAGDLEKAKHHTISTAAALANWHAAVNGDNTAMRPGINPNNGDA